MWRLALVVFVICVAQVVDCFVPSLGIVGRAMRSTARSTTSLTSVVECSDESCNFANEISNEGFTIVDFYADW